MLVALSTKKLLPLRAENLKVKHSVSSTMVSLTGLNDVQRVCPIRIWSNTKYVFPKVKSSAVKNKRAILIITTAITVMILTIVAI